MNRNQWILSTFAIAAVAGCHASNKPRLSRAVTQPTLQSAVLNNVDQRMSELRARAAVFTAAAKALPDDDPMTNRKLVVSAFDSASSALVLLRGPQPDGGFRQNLRIVDNIRQTIAGSSPDMAIDPATDTGLRAIYNALINLQDHYFPADRDVQTQLDIVRDKTDALDSVRGPLHSVAAAACFVADSDLINTMSAKLDQRASAPAFQPTTQPSLAPPDAAPTTHP